MTERMKNALFTSLALFVLALSALPAQAQVTVDIYGPGQSKMFIAYADPIAPGGAPAPGGAAQLQSLIQENIAFLPFLETIPSGGILGGTRLQGFTPETVDFERFQKAGADILVTTGWPSANTIEIRAMEAFTKRQLVGKSYTIANPKQITEVANKFCSALMEALTGHGEFFFSDLAYARRGKNGTNIYACHATGREQRTITSLDGYNMSPAWSFDKRYIAFTHIGVTREDRYHALGIWDSSGKVRTFRFGGASVVSPTFTSGNEVVVSLGINGAQNIYKVSRDFKGKTALVSSAGIDVSPSFDRSGRVMAFVSDRFGSPQIFVNGNAITSSGYNTDPTVSPDGKLVAYCKRTSAGHRIFVHDLTTGMDVQISNGPGSDEQPAFAPDSYFVAYTSGGVIKLTTRHGDLPKNIPGTGGGESPCWGYAPKE